MYRSSLPPVYLLVSVGCVLKGEMSQNIWDMNTREEYKSTAF